MSSKRSIEPGVEKGVNQRNVEGGKDTDSSTGVQPAIVGDVLPPPSFLESGEGLKRQLKNRHIAMISIGGVIGTGLFLGTAKALQQGGPIGLLLGYVAMGSLVYSVMISLGEMISFLPIPGGHITLASRFVNPAMSFTMGWLYWYAWMVPLPAELSAAATLVHFWFPESLKGGKELDPVWIIGCLLVVVAINLLGSGAYGEAEFFFASIKVITIIGLIILGIIIDLGGGPSHDRIGFRYWKRQPFVQFKDIPGATGRFLGWLSVLTTAAFSYKGTEIVAIAAGEAKNPRRNLPRAIRRVYIRILLFYIGGTAIIGLLVSPHDPGLTAGMAGTASASPFVVAIKNAGINALPSVINAALISSAWSAASSDLYTSSRALYGLALTSHAPRIFLQTNQRGVPLLSIGFNTLFAFLAFMSFGKGSARVFGWFMNLSSVAGLMTWFGIAVTYLRFYAGLKAQGYDRRTELPYSHPMQPWAGWYAVFGTFFVCLFSGFQFFLKGGWDTAGFITIYLSFILFFVLYIIGTLIYRTPHQRGFGFGFISPTEMDFLSDMDKIDAATYEESPRNSMEKLWRWLMDHNSVM